jgi:hypothetical protein
MAGQDIRKLVPAGGGFPIQVSGDYIYLKYADRAIDVIINGGRSGQTRVNMEAGDKYRPGPFEAFEVVNPDSERPAQVVFTVGEGDYNRQIITGAVKLKSTVETSLGGDQPDTRLEKPVFLSLDYRREEATEKGQNRTLNTSTTASLDVSNIAFAGVSSSGSRLKVYNGGSFPEYLTLDRQGQVVSRNPAPNTYVPIQSAVYIGGMWYLGIGTKVYKRAENDTNFVADDGSEVYDLGVGGYQLFTDGVGLYVLTSDYKIIKAASNEVLLVYSDSNSIKGAFWSGNKLVLVSISNRLRVFEWEGGQLTLTDTINTTGYNIQDPKGGYYDSARKTYVVLNISAGAVQWQEVETITAEGVMYGTAETVCLALPGLRNRAIQSDRRLYDGVTVEFENGKAYVSGAVIGAALALLGIENPEYLDMVTALKADSDSGIIDLNAGRTSFLAAEIADDFSRVELPGVVKITALKTLWDN